MAINTHIVSMAPPCPSWWYQKIARRLPTLQLSRWHPQATSRSTWPGLQVAVSIGKFRFGNRFTYHPNMWVDVGKTMPFLPPMTGNGSYLFIPPIKMVMTGGWFMKLFYPTLVNWMMIECTLSILLVHNNSGDVPLAAYNLRQTSLIDDFQDHLLDAGSDGGSTITGWYVYGSTVWGPQGPQGHKVSELATSPRNVVLKSNRWWKPLLGHIYIPYSI